MFHIEYLNLLRNAKSLCDKLIVGVTTDELALYKNKKPIISFEDRAEIVKNIKFVDLVIPQSDMYKVLICKKIHANYLFVDDDWYQMEKWKKYEEELNLIDCKVIYLPYTKKISSTSIRKCLENEN